MQCGMLYMTLRWLVAHKQDITFTTRLVIIDYFLQEIKPDGYLPGDILSSHISAVIVPYGEIWHPLFYLWIALLWHVTFGLRYIENITNTCMRASFFSEIAQCINMHLVIYEFYKLSHFNK